MNCEMRIYHKKFNGMISIIWIAGEILLLTQRIFISCRGKSLNYIKRVKSMLQYLILLYQVGLEMILMSLLSMGWPKMFSSQKMAYLWMAQEQFYRGYEIILGDFDPSTGRNFLWTCLSMAWLNLFSRFHSSQHYRGLFPSSSIIIEHKDVLFSRYYFMSII